MNAKTNLALLALGLGLSVPAFANDEHHPEKAAAAPVAAAAAPKADTKAMEANAAKLQAQVKRIAKAKPGPERDKLVAEHLHSLHEGMEIAKGMTSGMGMETCPMMDGKMGGKDMEGTGKPAGGDGDRMDRMDKRMDMMEQMMKGGMSKL